MLSHAVARSDSNTDAGESMPGSPQSDDETSRGEARKRPAANSNGASEASGEGRHKRGGDADADANADADGGGDGEEDGGRKRPRRSATTGSYRELAGEDGEDDEEEEGRGGDEDEWSASGSKKEPAEEDARPICRACVFKAHVAHTCDRAKAKTDLLRPKSDLRPAEAAAREGVRRSRAQQESMDDFAAVAPTAQGLVGDYEREHFHIAQRFRRAKAAGASAGPPVTDVFNPFAGRQQGECTVGTWVGATVGRGGRLISRRTGPIRSCKGD